MTYSEREIAFLSPFFIVFKEKRIVTKKHSYPRSATTLDPSFLSVSRVSIFVQRKKKKEAKEMEMPIPGDDPRPSLIEALCLGAPDDAPARAALIRWHADIIIGELGRVCRAAGREADSSMAWASRISTGFDQVLCQNRQALTVDECRLLILFGILEMERPFERLAQDTERSHSLVDCRVRCERFRKAAGDLWQLFRCATISDRQLLSECSQLLPIVLPDK
jgi:hypothetical protein